LNWDQNPVAQNVGGYIVSRDKSNCPIFVNYHKEEHISITTKYDDHFVDNNKFNWVSRTRRTLDSPEIKSMMSSDIRLPLFIKKNNDEGHDFYYMGDVKAPNHFFKNARMYKEDGGDVAVVKVEFLLESRVPDVLYNYITDKNGNS
jgi:hypothetical protein